MTIEGVNYYVDMIAKQLWEIDTPVQRAKNLRFTAGVLTLAWSGVMGEESRKIKLGMTSQRVSCPSITEEEYDQRILAEVYRFLEEKGIDPATMELLRDEDGDNYGYPLPEMMESREISVG